MRTYEGTIQLQSIGKLEGIKAKNIVVGDILIWNCGETSEVLEVSFSPSGKSVYCKILSNCSGKVYDRTFRAERIVAVKELNPAPAVEEVEAVVEAVEVVVEDSVEAVEEAIKGKTVDEQEMIVALKIENLETRINRTTGEERDRLRDLQNKLNELFCWLGYDRPAEQEEVFATDTQTPEPTMSMEKVISQLEGLMYHCSDMVKGEEEELENCCWAYDVTALEIAIKHLKEMVGA